MRERGTQSRRARADEMGPVERVPKGPPPPRGTGYWPVVAVIAIIIATAGWTTVAVMSISGSGSTAAQEPTDEPIDSFDDSTDGSDAPTTPSHDAPDLEALLPTEIAGTTLSVESWIGDTLLAEGGPLNDAIGAFVTAQGKSPSDLAFALASDPEEATDNSVGVFRLNGVPTAALRDAMIAAWKDQYPDLVVSTVTLDGTDVTKGAFGEDAIDSYWYEKDGLLFDIETSDEALATTIVTSLRDGTPLQAPPSPSGSPVESAPAGSPSPSPS